MNYRILGPAVQDMIHIDGWVEANFGEAAAVRASEKLFGTFALLALFQGLGRERPEVTAPPLRFYFAKPN